MFHYMVLNKTERIFSISIGLGAILALSACTTSMSQEQCISANWVEIGEKDAMAGKTGGKLAKRIDQCASFDVAADAVAYDQGYQRGLTQFCTWENGFRYGARGKKYESICPRNLEQDFLPAYQDGVTYFRIKDDLSDAKSDFNSCESGLDRNQRKIHKLRNEIHDCEDDECRQKRKNKIRRLKNENRDLRYRLDGLVDEIYDIERELDRFERWARNEGYRL